MCFHAGLSVSWVLFLKDTAIWPLEEERMGCSDEQGEVRERQSVMEIPVSQGLG